MRRHNRGYNDRYDCSAADINPIGSANKQLVWELLRWASKELDVPPHRAAPEGRTGVLYKRFGRFTACSV